MPIHLEEEIERSRQHLAEVVTKHQGNLLHPIVLQASQQLDTCIVKYQSFKRLWGRKRNTLQHQ